MAKQIKLFFDTIDLPKEEATLANIRAGSQTDLVLKIFKKHRGVRFTPFEIWVELLKKDKKILLTSVRRSITVLTTAKYLTKHRDKQRKAGFGQNNCTWEYNENESEHSPIINPPKNNDEK
jgi:Fe2+ or Zn2+ uptake regulation protein